jgi:carbamoyltransferase
MTDARVVLGVNRTQDASICLLDNSPSICSIQKERLSRQKHHWGQLNDFTDFYLKRIPALDQPIDLVVECYSSDREFENLDAYHRELTKVLNFRDEPRIIGISHHLAHLYSTFCLAPFNETAVMVIDFQGSRVRNFTESWPSPEGVQPGWVEVSSFYRCNRDVVKCLGKQLWDEDRSQPKGLGCFYHLMTRTMFPGEGNEGKVMGLAPYGDAHALGLPDLEVEGSQVYIPAEWLSIFKNHDRFHHFLDGNGSFEDCANLAAAGQKCFEDALLKVADWLYTQTGAETLCFAGGTALNCVANGRLLRESRFRNVFIPPSPHDGGTAVGCAIYGMTEVLAERSSFLWINDFLGPEPPPYLVPEVEPGLRVEKPSNLLERMCELLESGRVLGLYQVRSELGPRALGHRSILADPRRASIRTCINRNVKGRELFRPLAPIVLEHMASQFFDIDRPAPFMQFAADVRSEKREIIPAVTHVDGTARIQTVSERDDAFLYSLLKAFEERTGVGVLLNTSFNGKNEPIVESPQEAFACFKATAIHALVMPPYLITKEAEPGLP